MLDASKVLSQDIQINTPWLQLLFRVLVVPVLVKLHLGLEVAGVGADKLAYIRALVNVDRW